MLTRRRVGAQRLGGIALAILLSACSPGRAIEAIDVLNDIAAGSGPSRFKAMVPPPIRHGVAYQKHGRNHEGDIYEPSNPSGVDLVLVAGLAEEGKDDPRLVAFAGTLARAGFRVLVPEIRGMRKQQARPSDIAEITDAILYFDAPQDAAKRPHEALVAVSYAVGPTVIAALDPEVGSRIAFIVGIGGYYDIEAVVTFFTTGYFRVPGGEWRHRTPNAYGKWVFALNNADRLNDQGDRRLIRDIARRKMGDPDAPVLELVSLLGPEGRAVYALLVNDRPDAVPRLIADVPEGIREDMRALNPKQRDLTALPGCIVLIHGRDDTIIPYTESEALAAAAGGKSSLYLPGSLAHVDIGPLDLFDGIILFRAVYEILEERDLVRRPQDRIE